VAKDVFDLLGRAKNLDALREELGGRAQSESGAGEIVTCAGKSGVVIFAQGDEREVWLGAGRVRRATSAELTAALATDELRSLSAKVRAFTELEEGARVVLVERSGAPVEATIVEKYRYGALLAREDGSLVAAGFARLTRA